jgi:hypothetical protein
MKKLLLLGSIAVCLAMMASNNVAIAQEDESTTVHITIKEDGKVMTDTTFELKEGQDPDMVKKMVEHMVGEDDDCDHKELAWVHMDSDDTWNITSDDMGVDLDSIKKAHGGAKVMVFKDEDGNITVKELGDDEDHEMHFQHEGHGDHEIMIISDDEHMEWTENDEDGENVEVYVIKKGDKDVKVIKKKITVEVETDADADVEKEVEVEVEVKTEKK